MNHLTLSLGGLQPPGGSVTYCHSKKYDHSAAYTLGECIQIRLSAPRVIGVYSAKLHYYNDSGCEIGTFDGSWITNSGEYDIYEFCVNTKPPVGLYFYTIELLTACGAIYANPSANEAVFESSPRNFQITVSEFLHDAPEEFYGGIIYHIFVDRFARSGRSPKKENATLVDDWSEGVPEYPEYHGAFLRNNTFWGGDLWGIIGKLPYIASLGVNVIYLSPIFDSASNHKYDTGDYMHVDAMFGGDSALKSLIREARSFGISIILDGVFNHTGSDSLYFNRYSNYPGCGAYQSKESPYYSWYDFKSHPDDYTSWWGIEILPRINPDSPSCREFFVGKNGVIEHYARMGIRGFRLDVVDELSDEFVASIKSALSEAAPNNILYGEVWEDASNKIAYNKRKRYYLGEELDGVMNYPLRAGIIDYICKRETERLRYALTDIINNAPKRIRDAQMNILSTHDTERILTVLGGVPADGKSNAELRVMRMSDSERREAISRLKAAYTIIATLPGIPSIYYGDEAGLEGYGDPFNRMPYPWGGEDSELLCHYKRIGALRRGNPIYRDADFKLLHLDSDILAFSRENGKEAFITVINRSDFDMEIGFSNKSVPMLNTSYTLSPMSAEVYKTKAKSSIFFKLPK